MSGITDIVRTVVGSIIPGGFGTEPALQLRTAEGSSDTSAPAPRGDHFWDGVERLRRAAGCAVERTSHGGGSLLDNFSTCLHLEMTSPLAAMEDSGAVSVVRNLQARHTLLMARGLAPVAMMECGVTMTCPSEPTSECGRSMSCEDTPPDLHTAIGRLDLYMSGLATDPALVR